MSVLDIATAQVLIVGLCQILLSIFLPLEALRLAFWEKEVAGGCKGRFEDRGRLSLFLTTFKYVCYPQKQDFDSLKPWCILINEKGLAFQSRVQRSISPGILHSENFKLGRKENKAENNSKDNSMTISWLQFEIKLNFTLRKFRQRIGFVIHLYKFHFLPSKPINSTFYPPQSFRFCLYNKPWNLKIRSELFLFQLQTFLYLENPHLGLHFLMISWVFCVT